jgi:uncharacterized protein YkwD
MTGQGSRNRNRFFGFAGLALVALLLVGCMSQDDVNALSALNSDRAANGGLAALELNDALYVKAQGWAQHLADASGGECTLASLSHSDLRVGAPAGWTKLGENVACRTTTADVASTVGPIEGQFMNSPPHRANILDRDFNRGGVALASVPARTGGGVVVVFETQEFAHL